MQVLQKSLGELPQRKPATEATKRWVANDSIAHRLDRIEVRLDSIGDKLSNV